MKNLSETKTDADFELMPEWIRTRVILLGFGKGWIHEPIPALGDKSIFEAFFEKNYEMIMRVFGRNAEFSGNENPILYSLSEEEIRQIETVSRG